MMSTADIKSDDLTIKLDHSSNLCLILLPLVSLLLNLFLPGIEFSLHVHVESLQEFVISDQLVSNLVVFECTVVEQVVNFGDMLRENFLDLLDTRTPNALHVADSGHAIDVDSLG